MLCGMVRGGEFASEWKRSFQPDPAPCHPAVKRQIVPNLFPARLRKIKGLRGPDQDV